MRSIVLFSMLVLVSSVAIAAARTYTIDKVIDSKDLIIVDGVVLEKGIGGSDCISLFRWSDGDRVIFTDRTPDTCLFNCTVVHEKSGAVCKFSKK